MTPGLFNYRGLGNETALSVKRCRKMHLIDNIHSRGTFQTESAFFVRVCGRKHSIPEVCHVHTGTYSGQENLGFGGEERKGRKIARLKERHHLQAVLRRLQHGKRLLPLPHAERSHRAKSIRSTCCKPAALVLALRAEESGARFALCS